MRPRWGFNTFLVAGLALALALAFLVSPSASNEPDGLSRAANDEGFDDEERAHSLEGMPTAGYDVRGVDNDGFSKGLAGALGVAATFAISGSLFVALRRSGSSRAQHASEA